MRLRIFSAVLFPAPLRPMMTERFAAFHLERDILQRPKFPAGARVEFLTAEHLAGHGREKIAQRIISLPFPEFLVDMLHAERDVRHERSPFRCFPRKRVRDA